MIIKVIERNTRFRYFSIMRRLARIPDQFPMVFARFIKNAFEIKKVLLNAFPKSGTSRIDHRQITAEPVAETMENFHKNETSSQNRLCVV